MKNLMFLFLAMSLFLTSCGSDSEGFDDVIGGRKGVHKIEVTVTASSEDITTILVFTGIGKDGLNATASLYNEEGKKCGDGTDTRTIENGSGKFVCYTDSDATGLMGNMSVVCFGENTTAKMESVAYINNKEVSRIEKTFTSGSTGQLTIQTF